MEPIVSSSLAGTSVPKNTPDTVQDTVGKAAIVYAGIHYGRKHTILRRLGTNLVVQYQPFGVPILVNSCDVEVLPA